MADISFSCDDIVIESDIVEMTEEDKQVKEVVDKRDRQLKRWFITLNNPFYDPSVAPEVDVLTTDLPVNRNYYNLEYIKGFNNIDLFEFHFIEVTAKIEEIVVEKVLKQVSEHDDTKLVEVEVEKKIKVEKTFVVERPYFKDYESLKTYIENLEVDGLKYAVGQIEKGHQDGTVHLQAGLIFDEKHGKRFYTMKKYFPTAFLDKVRGTNFDVKVYCTKEDTRIEEPFEIGKFSEMRARNDYEEFKSALKQGATDDQLIEDFYHIVAQVGLKNIQLQRDVLVEKEFGEKCRDIEVYYIYGKGGVGKTRSIYREHKFSEVFKLTRYGQFCFHGYKHQRVVLMDEFTGQVKIQTMNNWLDHYPLQVEIKGGGMTACYTKVYIVSNIPYHEMYKVEKEENRDIYNTFDRRINHIIEVNDNGEFIKKRETIFEDIPEEEIELEGWTRREAKIIHYDAYGLPHTVYDRHGKVEQQQFETVDEIDDLIFGDEE